MWEILVGAAVGGLFNTLSEQSKAKQAQANIERTRAAMGKSLIDDMELERLLMNNQRFYSSRLTNLMNTTAISGRGFANIGAIKAAAAAPMLAESAGRASQIEQGVLQHNKQVNTTMANLGLGMPVSDPWGSTFSGMLEGGLAGYELSKGAKTTTQPMTSLPKMTSLPESTTTSKPEFFNFNRVQELPSPYRLGPELMSYGSTLTYGPEEEWQYNLKQRQPFPLF